MLNMKKEKQYNKYLKRVQFWLCTLEYSKIGMFFHVLYENYKIKKLK